MTPERRSIMWRAAAVVVRKFVLMAVRGGREKFSSVIATIGVFGLMVVNLVAYLFTPGGLGLRDGGALAIIFSLVCIVIASMNLVMDFDMIERGIRNGADQKFAWYASFGITVTLVWLYIEILRLLGYMRD